MRKIGIIVIVFLMTIGQAVGQNVKSNSNKMTKTENTESKDIIDNQVKEVAVSKSET